MDNLKNQKTKKTGKFTGILKLEKGANFMLVANTNIDDHFVNDLNVEVMGFQKC